MQLVERQKWKIIYLLQGGIRQQKEVMTLLEFNTQF